MSKESELTFKRIIQEARVDPNILGLFLSGSRGKGFETIHSDYDIVMIIANGLLGAYEERYPFYYEPGVECILHSLTGFRGYAAHGSDDAWDRYSFAHVKALLDKTGEIQSLIDAKGRLSADVQAGVVKQALDSYVNSFYRSLKCHRRDNRLGVKLEANLSVPPLLTFLFGLEGRHAPFLGYLEGELRHYPLTHLPFKVTEFLELIDRVSSGDVAAQGRLFN